jgi:Putative Zn-dependent protease, contains TPR repeats
MKLQGIHRELSLACQQSGCHVLAHRRPDFLPHREVEMHAGRYKWTVTLAALLLAGCATEKAKQPVTTAAASMPLWEVSTKSDEARARIADGERLADAGFQLAAHEQFKHAVAADTAFAYAYLRYAETSYSAAEFATYLARAEGHAATANPTEKLLILADRKGIDNDVQGAIDVLKQVVAANPTNARGYVILGNAQLLAGQVADGRASFQKAIALAPTVGLPSLQLASSYIFLEPKNFAEADKYAVAGQKLWPNEPLSYDVLGRVRRSQSRLEEAAAAYSREVELNPKESNGYAVRGNAYTFLGQYDKARADYDQALRVSRPEEVPWNAGTKALIGAYAGDWKGAINELDQVIQATAGMQTDDPNGPTIQNAAWAIEIAVTHNAPDLAEKEYPKLEAAVKAQLAAASKSQTTAQSEGFARFFNANLAYARGLIAVFKGDYPAAQKSIDEIIKLRAADNDPTKDRNVHALRGYLALLQKKDYATAVSEFKQGDPTDQMLRYYTAVALESGGKSPESKALYQALSNFNFTDGTYAAVRNMAIEKAQ